MRNIMLQPTTILLLAALGLVACGSDTEVATGGNAGAATSVGGRVGTGTGGNAGAATSVGGRVGTGGRVGSGGSAGGATSVGSGGSAGGNGGKLCGGIVGMACDAGQFCSYALDARCGAADQMGNCTAIPQLCSRIYSPVCGCNGQTYDNECGANAAGVSVAANAACQVST